MDWKLFCIVTLNNAICLEQEGSKRQLDNIIQFTYNNSDDSNFPT
jgi:hypothetical protein